MKNTEFNMFNPYKILKIKKDASLPEIERVYSAILHPSKKETMAYKQLKDPYFSSLLSFKDNNEMLEKAGFFVDSLSLKEDKELASSLFYTTSLAKVKEQWLVKNKPLDKNIILLTTGGFSPFHEGHLSMMEEAKIYLETKGFNVLGGFISPSHDIYVSSKYQGEAKNHVLNRNTIIQKFLEKNSWLELDPWEASFVRDSINYSDVILHLKNYLSFYLPEIIIEDVCYVFGSDNIDFTKAFIKKGMSLAVARNDYQLLASKKRELKIDDEKRFFLPATTHSHFSSKKIRSGELSSSFNLNENKKEPSLYLVRDDLGHNLSSLKDDRFFDSSLLDFKTSFKLLMEKTFSSKKIVFLELSLQQKYLDQLCQDKNVLNLDSQTRGGVDLKLSRLFLLNGLQQSAIKLFSSDDLAKKIKSIKEGEYILLDDDIASGYTMKTIKAMLPKKVVIKKEISLCDISLLELGLSKPFFDIIDLRDFLFGAKDGGLFTETPSEEIFRLPYLYPFVNLSERMKMEPSKMILFSLSLLELNLAFFSSLEKDYQLYQLSDHLVSLSRFLPARDNMTIKEFLLWIKDQYKFHG